MTAFISVFDLFRVGVGPSSSHTVGPMRAALDFLVRLGERVPERVQITLVGSLAHTGRGHHTDQAVLWGLAGLTPETFLRAEGESVIAAAYLEQRITLGRGGPTIAFDPARDLVFDVEREVSVHPNEVIFEAFERSGVSMERAQYFSIGGGFIATSDERQSAVVSSIEAEVPFPFRYARELVALSERTERPIWELMRDNELTARSSDELAEGLRAIWSVMSDCIERGARTDGELPGGLSIKRRAPILRTKLESRANIGRGRVAAPDRDWVHMWAMAVNEENAAGGRVVTAPTNGAAGIVPAVFRYYQEFCADADDISHDEALLQFFLTAAAIGSLFKRNASISGAEVGCQGEVGAAASMAAAGLCALYGGTAAQVENAAEIAIEHSLGLTCDPVAGLVQVPCIERNGFGAGQAISAARLAMLGDGSHHISLDKAIATMRQTGQDMSAKYKETSLGGLAVIFVEC